MTVDGRAGTPLDARALDLGYEGTLVCRGVSLHLPRGQVTALVGPNGSGKSTLLRAVARLHQPDAGSVVLEGRDLGAYSPRELARRLSFLTQSPLVPPGISVRDLVGYGRHPHRGLLARSLDPDDRAAVAWALEVTSLEALAERPLDRLSGGERQRAWIAMALAQRTDVVLLDEPTTYLDIRYQIEVLDLMRWLVDEHGITVAVVLHDLNQAAAYADRMLVLARGVIVAGGPPEEVMTARTIRDAFKIETTVITDPHTGLPACLPYRRSSVSVS